MKFVDFLKPRWKHSDPKIRAEAIKELEPDYNLDDLIDIILSDELIENQKLALRKVNEENALVRIKENAAEKVIKESAQLKLNELWTKKIKQEGDESLKLQVLDNITDFKFLEDIALSNVPLKIKEICLHKIDNPASFYKIALKEAEPKLAIQAFGKVTKSGQLENLSKKAQCKEVRQKAKERLPNATAMDEDAEEKVASAKFELLCSTMEGLHNPNDWEKAHQEAVDAEETWDNMVSQGLTPELVFSNRFLKAKNQFWGMYHKHQEREAQKAKEKHEIQQNTQAKQELCDSFDRLVNSKRTPERNEVISELIAKWDTLGQAQDEDEQRFNLLFQRLLNQYRQGEREAQEALAKIEKAQFAADSKEEQITSLVQEMQSLADNPDFKRAQSKFQELTKKWDSLEVGEDHPLLVSFNEAVEKGKNTLEKLEEKQSEQHRQQLDKMKELVPEMEALVDNPDIVSAEKDSRELFLKWKELDTIHTPNDGSLAQEYHSLKARVESAMDSFKEAQEWLRWANLKKKQDICAQLTSALEQNLESKDLYQRLRELQSEWRAIGPVSWDSSKEVWDQYRQITDDIYEKCKDYFSELEEERNENLKLKEDLCQLVEAQKETTNWKESSEIIRNSQDKWKDIGPVPKEQSESIWSRFRNACDAFFQTRKAYFEDLGKDKEENLAKKIKLCELVESHQEDTSWKESAEIFKNAQEEWKNTGPIPKEKIEELWERFRKACDYFFQRREGYFKQLEAKKGENLKKKEELCVQVENLDAFPSDAEKFNIIKKAQAEWKAIGPVEKDKAKSIWERFRKPIDAYFEERKEKFQEEQKVREENLKKKEELTQQAIMLSDSNQWRETSESLKSLQAAWKEIGPAPRDKDREIWNQFRGACDTFFSRMKDHYRQLDDQRELNLRTKEDLCFQAEVLAGFETMDSEDHNSEEINWSDSANRIKELQRKWKQTGPVPKARSDELWLRFRKACDYVFDYVRMEESKEVVDLDSNLQMKMEICDEAERISKQVHTDSQIMKIKELQKEWKRIGPVPVDSHADTWERFKKACDLVFAEDERLRS